MTKQKSDQDLYDELSLYTLSHSDSSFIHQYIVDAYAAQHAGENTKPITLAFALMGLYLHIEKSYSGKEIQNAHMQMGKTKKEWPTFDFPRHRGDVTVLDVLETKSGIDRDQMINEWSDSVWQSWIENHEEVADWLQSELNI